MVVVAVTQGVLAGFGYWLIGGLDFSVFLGFVTGFASFVPLAGRGPRLDRGVELPAVHRRGRAARSGSRCGASLVVSSADNWIKPIFIGGRAKLPTSLLLIALLGGLQVYGFLGVFLGPVILALLLTFVAIYRELYVARPLIQPAVPAEPPPRRADRVGLTPQHRLGLRDDLAQHVAGGLDLLERRRRPARPGSRSSDGSACSRQ